jgi:hypothetical protein
MGRPKNSTRARRNNAAKAAKAASYRRHGVEEDRAPGEARNGENLSEVIEENSIYIDNQREWSESGEEVCAASSDSSSVVCLDQEDEEDIGRQETTNLNMVLFKGVANWQGNSYWAGLDGPQAAWACKKYRGHRTLPADALREARASV